MKVKKVLAVMAHPDDLEALCAGTLARFVRNGVKVDVTIVTDGSSGHDVIPADQLKGIREKETKEALKYLKAGLFMLGFRDAMCFEGEAMRIKLVQAIRESAPDIIITHKPDDYHPDHNAISREVARACFSATLQNIRTGQPKLRALPQLFYADSWISAGFLATDFVDITGTLQVKMKMLKCHKSQYIWLKKHDSTDMFTLVKNKAEFNGFQCGVKYAEAFRKEINWPIVRAERLLP